VGVVRTSIDIDAPPDRVWSTVTNLQRLGDWVTIHEEFPEPPPEEVAKGTTFAQKLKLSGVEVEVEWTAARVEEAKRLDWRGRGPTGSKARTSYRLSDQDGGTRFDYENEFELPGGAIGKAVAGAVDGQSEKEARASLERLKKLVEG
jgi:ligand-binding SRPBCC domain-containing protein